MSIPSRWLLCRVDRRSLAGRLDLYEDGSVVGGSQNESTWSVSDGVLQFYGADNDRRLSFPLKPDHRGELSGEYFPREVGAATIPHVLRPLGPEVSLQHGMLSVSTSDPTKALELIKNRIDFSYILHHPTKINNSFGVLTFDSCKIDTYQGLQFFESEYLSEPMFINVLHDAVLVCGSVVLSRDGIAINETTSFAQNRALPFDFTLTADHRAAYLPSSSGITVRYAKTSFLFNNIYNNYGHWHLQSACNAEAYAGFQQLLSEDIDLLSFDGVGVEHFRRDAISALGLDPESVIRTPRQPGLTHERYDRLIVPSALGVPHALHFHSGRVEALAKLKRKRTANGQRRLYLSRRDVGNARGIVNTDELSSALTTLGFAEIVTSEMSYEQELQSFADADIVVAPHGGGLTNMIAHEGGLKIFEIFHSKQLNGWYKNLAALCGHEYAAYCIDLPHEEAPKGWHGSFKVDVSKVILALQKLLDT